MNQRLTPYVVAIVVGVVLVGANQGGGLWSTLEPFVGGFTAVVAIWLFFEEWRRADRAALPRRLTVRYMHAGEAVYTEEQAYLTHEGDARQLAQQIARQINNNKNVDFDATQVTELLRGPEIDRKDPLQERRVFTLHVDVPLSNGDQVHVFRAHAAGRKSDGPSVPEPAAREAGSTETPRAPVARLFVCAGEAVAPVGFEVVQCPAVMTAEAVQQAARAVRQRVARATHAEILVKGPVTLGVALGHVLQHVPCRVDFLQLDQATKETSVWWSNTDVA